MRYYKRKIHIAKNESQNSTLLEFGGFSLAIFTGKKYLEIQNCICYNASRQKEETSPSGRRTNPQTVLQLQFGDSSFLLQWQSTH